MVLRSYVASLIFAFIVISFESAIGTFDPSTNWKGPFLIPLLVYGPNNQLAGLKEILTLAKLLQLPTLLPPIFNHYTNVQSAKEPRWFPFEQLFDLEYLASHQKVYLLSEWRTSSSAGSWNGSLDALLYIASKKVEQASHHIRGCNLSYAEAEMLELKVPRQRFACTRKNLMGLLEMLHPHRVVGIVAYNELVPGAPEGLSLVTNGDLCHDTYLQVSGHMRKSKTVVEIAQAFIARHLGGRPYMAVHIRPYTDACHDLWTRKNGFTDKEAMERCKNMNLHHVIGPSTVAQMEDKGVRHLFVLAHPAIRGTINKIYAKYNLTPIYMELDFMSSVSSGWTSITQLALAEAEVAVRSKVFMGTSQSSMTAMILQERAGSGIPRYDTLTFLKSAIRPEQPQQVG